MDCIPGIGLSAPERGGVEESSLRALEFDRLLEHICSFAHSDATRQSVRELRPLAGKEDIEKRLGHCAEILLMAQKGEPLRLLSFPDITPLMARVRPEGAVLEGFELAGLIAVLQIIAEILLQTEEREDIPRLREVTESLTGFPDLLRALERSLDSEGGILDTASFALSEIRGRIRRLEGRIRRKLEEMVREESVSVFLQDTFITSRSGRWVIPVRMDSKGQVPGVVHDVSKSGETAFIEPLPVIHLSNELENLMAEQRAEEIRILRSLSAGVREAAEELSVQYRIIVYLDTLSSVARLADSLRMQIPRINESGVTRLVNARHPLLTLSLWKADSGRQVVPLDVEMGGGNTVMVITGSNAGGKTIAIKTIGLLLAMALSGMPVPADSSSDFPLVRSLLIDIGDEQSIESNLSTFSAHVTNIAKILRGADARALVLIDELGTGTDPDEGAALACAVLNELRSSGATVFATTHLTDIKGFVHRTEGMLNASMEFDQETLTPLYRLRVGEPGQSHALEIARKYGLPVSIIDSAKAMLGGIKGEFDNLIADLDEKRAQYERGLDELRRQREDAEERSKRLETLLAEAEARQKELLAKAYQEASVLVTGIKREMHALLEEARRQEREKSREALKQAGRIQEEVDRKLREFLKEDDGAPSIDELEAGDVVFVRSLGCDAPIVEINLKHSRVKVRAGNMEVEVPAADLRMKKGQKAQAGRESSAERGPTEEAAPSRLHLVGLRVDEALSRLEPFLNHASLAGLTEVTIIHGMGTGILLKAVREHLQGHPLVRGFRSGEPQEGGSGVTVAALV